MFDAISGKTTSKINPDLVIQADELNTPSETLTFTTLTCTTSTTTVNTSPITTNIVPIFKSDVEVKSPIRKTVTFNKPTSSYAAYFVPQGSKDGRKKLLEATKYDGLMIVTLNRGQKYESIEAINSELHKTIVKFAPANERRKIGLGGGALCMFIRRYVPHVNLLTVEIDKAILDVGKSYFDFIEDDKSKVRIADDVPLLEPMPQEPDEDQGTQEEEEEPVIRTRNKSGPRTPDPYESVDSSFLLQSLPICAAIGAFIPLLFCLCKL
uniref:PABS domain-containing protein n=1 Tax=Trichogramma kaykai TaxID=54128 RepID=A0ABD2W266_9HYME